MRCRGVGVVGIMLRQTMARGLSTLVLTVPTVKLSRRENCYEFGLCVSIICFVFSCERHSKAPSVLVVGSMYLPYLNTPNLVSLSCISNPLILRSSRP